MSRARRSRSTEAFFGRRHGKPLRSAQADSLERILPRLLLDLSQECPSDPLTLFDTPVSMLRLEIGFGGGEHLHLESGRNAEAGFIGVEPFVNGMAKLVTRLDADPRSNLRLYDDDATRVLDWLPPDCVGGIDLFYPDPWPKRKHWKRRFVSAVNLDRFARVMKSGSIFRFASDIDTYVNWTLLACRAHPAFEWLAVSPLDWREPYAGWQSTRYEAKAVREGRVPAYLSFRRH